MEKRSKPSYWWEKDPARCLLARSAGLFGRDGVVDSPPPDDPLLLKPLAATDSAAEMLDDDNAVFGAPPLRVPVNGLDTSKLLPRPWFKPFWLLLREFDDDEEDDESMKDDGARLPDKPR